MSVAARVAEEMGVKLGNEVHHIRYPKITLMIKHLVSIQSILRTVSIQSTLRTAGTILLFSLIHRAHI